MQKFQWLWPHYGRLTLLTGLLAGWLFSAQAEQSLTAQLHFANDYIFRGLPQNFDTNGGTPKRTTMRGELRFSSADQFFFASEGITRSNDLEFRLKAGFSSHLQITTLDVVFHRYQFERRTNFEELHFRARSQQFAILVVKGLDRAGNAHAFTFRGQASQDTDIVLEWGRYQPSVFQRPASQQNNPQYLNMSLQQNFSGVILSAAYWYNIEDGYDAVVFSIGSNWEKVIDAKEN